MFGRCLGGVWEVFGRCLGVVWDVFGECSGLLLNAILLYFALFCTISHYFVHYFLHYFVHYFALFYTILHYVALIRCMEHSIIMYVTSTPMSRWLGEYSCLPFASQY